MCGLSHIRRSYELTIMSAPLQKRNDGTPNPQQVDSGAIRARNRSTNGSGRKGGTQPAATRTISVPSSKQVAGSNSPKVTCPPKSQCRRNRPRHTPAPSHKRQPCAARSRVQGVPEPDRGTPRSGRRPWTRRARRTESPLRRRRAATRYRCQSNRERTARCRRARSTRHAQGADRLSRASDKPRLQSSGGKRNRKLVHVFPISSGRSSRSPP